MRSPHLTIDLKKIEHNTRTIVNMCEKYGIKVSGVTKVTCGHADVAKAMLSGGVVSIADSRFENIDRLKSAGINTEYMLLRIPPLSAADETVNTVDISLNSEVTVLEALSKAAEKRGKIHNVILMVDLGDLREGLLPEDVLPAVRQVSRYSGIRIVGLGTNLACFAGVIPSEDNMHQLVELAEKVEHTFKISLLYISGINSSGLELIASGRMPKRVNHARIGEAILLGRETIHRNPWPDTYQDAFLLHAEILELKHKPSLPIGERSQDAFGKLTRFEEHGVLLRALVNIGREDVDLEGIHPLDENIKVLTASSGYLGLDVTNSKQSLKVGDTIVFRLNYSALLAAMTSEYVKKHVISKVEG